MTRRWWWGGAAWLGCLWAGCRPAATPPEPTAASVAELLGGAAGAAAGFVRATAVPQLEFPRDHGPHPGFRTEWWYLTGNLQDRAGRRFGVQLVFFRQALAPFATARRAASAAHELVLAHAAVTDVDGGRFHHEQRLARHAAGLAVLNGPAPGQPLHLACDDWSMRGVAQDGGLQVDGQLPLELRAGGRDFAFALRAGTGKPLVLQGDRGLSAKGPEPGNASIYYSLPRLPLEGTVTVLGVDHAVTGQGWFDREWSTSALADDVVGWDWFALQLDSGEEVMWYQLRRPDGTATAQSRGVLVAADGAAQPLLAGAVAAVPEGRWVAPDGAASYPARWRLAAADGAFELAVVPLLADQELHTVVRYWEGAVSVTGLRAGRPVLGVGYLEMTGARGGGRR
ncbi:MAG: carotenoid 1,2-hydratase [Planctomycetes bacterium]|nr:carotenoid 1,2-hydratase [Planctomycetota bacterium]